MKKIIFLDIDGVLNSRKRTQFPCKQGIHNEMDEVCPEKVALLNQIILATGAVVVISSTWRILNTFWEIQEFLNCAGFVGEIIGATPKNGWDRGDEIEQWILPRVKEIEHFIILDDGSDMGGLMSRLIQTSFETGLLQKHVDKAIEMLERK